MEPQANHLPGNFFPCSNAYPQYNHHVLHDVRVSLVRLGNLPFASAHVFGHDILQNPPAASGGQLEGRWEDVLPASGVERDVVQGTLQDPQRINVANYGIANYPERSGVSEVCRRGLSSSCTDTPPATPSILQFHTHISMSDLVKIFQDAKMTSSTCVPTCLC